MQPKARWTRTQSAINAWTAMVGPFRLDVAARDGWCMLSQRDPLELLWEQHAPTPCDVTDLMRLTEAELARRLEHAAGTMEGSQLVAECCECEEEEEQPRSFYGKQPLDACVPPPAAEKPRWLVAQSRSCAGPLSGEEVLGIVAPPAKCISFDPSDTLPHPFSAGASEPPRFKVGDQVTAKHWTTLRNTMIAAVGTLKHKNEDGSVVVAFGSRSSVTCWPRDLELYDAAPAFKVGDLVRTLCGSVLPVIAVFAEKVRVRRAASVEFDMAPETLEPYTLPPINSYAELAAVLDELPAGWRVERCRKSGDGWSTFTRGSDGLYQESSGGFSCTWTKRELLAGTNEPRYPESTHRVLPPESGK